VASESISHKFKLAATLSLVAGVLILCVGLIAIPVWWDAAYWPHGSSTWLSSFSVSLIIVCGALITVSAVFLYRNPQHNQTFGLIIFFASPLSLLALGILSPQPGGIILIMTILMFIGMIGGALSITCKEK
jgi:hypothetical protein